MAGLFSTSSALLSSSANPVNIRANAQAIRSLKSPLSANLATALDQIQSAFDQIYPALRASVPSLATLGVTDSNGNLIAWWGSKLINGTQYLGLWAKNAYLGGADASSAILVAPGDGTLTITGATIHGTLGTTTGTINYEHAGGASSGTITVTGGFITSFT